MASIFSLDKQVASLPKHGFPMSQTFDFTSSCGHLIPVYFDQLNPGEKIRYSVDLFTRTQPMAAPANVEIDEYIDVFFVPLKKISAAADNILFQISDFPSSSLPDTITDVVLPLLDLSKLQLDFSTPGGSNTYLGTWSSGVTELGAYSPFFESYYAGIYRLFDALAIDPTVFYANSGAYTPMIKPDALAVYQAIYYDYYRPSSWQGNQIHAYNLDAGYSSLDLLSTGLPWATSMGLRQLVQLHYRAWYKDYLTNVFPSPLINTTSMLSNAPINLSVINNWLVSSNLRPIDGSGVMSNYDPLSVAPLPSSDPINAINGRTLLSASNLRSIFAVDKLLKVTARAGKHYDDQVLAHFGFKVPKGYSGEVVHLGTHHQQVRIGEVISTASTSTGEIGELAGKGYGKQVSRIVDSFTAPCHGYFMAIYSSVPKVAYVGGIDRIHTMVKRYDWFIPELDNLGMQPMFFYENNIVAPVPTGRMAWQLRYYQMKDKKDHATYAFKSTANVLSGLVYNDGPFAEWNITDPFPYGSVGVELGRLLVSPGMLSEIMLASYVPTPQQTDLIDADGNPAPGNLYASDPLIHHCVQSVSKISGMSIYGLDDKAI